MAGGGWSTLGGKYNAGWSLNVNRKKLGGAHLLSLFEQWPPEPPTPFDFASRGRRSDLHLEHIPLVDSHWTGLAQEIGAETAPMPEFRRGHQTALHRISMHVAKFLDGFVLGPYVEIIEPFLPDMLRPTSGKSARSGALPVGSIDL